jgi:histidinol-phosphate aminotransferase
MNAATSSTASAYAPPALDQPIDLDLSRNECRALINLGACLSSDLDPAKYPGAASLERALAERFAVSPDRVLVTAGADDAIDRVIRLALTDRPAGAVITHAPTFEMIPVLTQRAGGRVRSCRWLDADFPEQSLLDAVDPDAALLTLVTPNNPTGRVIDRETLLRVVDRASACSLPILVDLAYAEFTGDDPTAELLARPNVVVTRTFSKAWGLAGLRVGYALGNSATIARLRAIGAPFPVSSVSARIAEIALQTCEGAMTETVRAVEQARDQLAVTLRSLGADPIESRANFILARFDDAEATWNGLASRGIAVRRFEGNPDLTDMLRITAPPDPADCERLCNALSDILAEDPS